MSPSPPDYADVLERRQLALTGLGSALDQSDSDDHLFSGDWLWIASFALQHTASYVKSGESVLNPRYGERHRSCELLPDIDFPSLERLRFQERESCESAKSKSLDEYAQERAEENLVVTYGGLEHFWQTLGAREFAARDYVVFPEYHTQRWAPGIPDLAVFRLGALQETLSDIGLLAGGGTLQEIELRSYYNRYDSTQIDVERAVGVVEAKAIGNERSGYLQLAQRRNTDKEPYLNGDAVEQGWLVCPKAGDEIRSGAEIGGLTWNTSGTEFHAAPHQTADSQAKAEAVQDAKRILLQKALKYQSLPASLPECIENCIADPDYLYEIFD